MDCVLVLAAVMFGLALTWAVVVPAFWWFAHHADAGQARPALAGSLRPITESALRWWPLPVLVLLAGLVLLEL